MRRKVKHGIYTNRTVRRCFCCSSYCQNCKSECKVIHNCQKDPTSIADNHYGYSSKKLKLHQYGTGSILPRRKFVQYNYRSHRRDNTFSPHSPGRVQRRKLEPYIELKDWLEEIFQQEVLKQNIQKKSNFPDDNYLH